MNYEMKDLRAVKGYFRGYPVFGRITKLVHVPTGKVIFEGMGVCSKKSLWAGYLNQIRLGNITA